MLDSVQRFGAMVNKAFLDRGTVRRGGLVGAILEFVRFAYERENMLLHIFRLEAKALPSGRRKKVPSEPKGCARDLINF